MAAFDTKKFLMLLNFFIRCVVKEYLCVYVYIAS